MAISVVRSEFLKSVLADVPSNERILVMSVLSRCLLHFDSMPAPEIADALWDAVSMSVLQEAVQHRHFGLVANYGLAIALLMNELGESTDSIARFCIRAGMPQLDPIADDFSRPLAQKIDQRVYDIEGGQEPYAVLWQSGIMHGEIGYFLVVGTYDIDFERTALASPPSWVAGVWASEDAAQKAALRGNQRIQWEKKEKTK